MLHSDYYRARQKSATALNEAWITQVRHKLLWRDAHVRCTRANISQRVVAVYGASALKNRKVPMK